VEAEVDERCRLGDIGRAEVEDIMTSEFFLSRDIDVRGRSKLIRNAGEVGDEMLREYSSNALAVSDKE